MNFDISPYRGRAIFCLPYFEGGRGGGGVHKRFWTHNLSSL